MCKKVIIKNLMKDVLVFTCQFDWVKGIWECLWRCFWKVSVWIQKLSKEDLRYRCGLVSSNPLKVWIELKAEETWFHSLVELDHPFSPSLWHQHSWFLGVWTWTDQDFDICSLDSPALEFGLKQHHQFSWASSSQVEIVGLLSIHNCVSQYFTAAVLLNIYMYSTCSFSLANILVPKWF